MDFKEVSGTVNVPPNTGVEGFVHTIRAILKKDRLQSINIDARGQVTYRYFAPSTELENGQNFGVDFEALEPYYIIRNAEVREVDLPVDLSAAVGVGVLLDQAASDRMQPIAFATGAQSALWPWYEYTTGHVPRDRLHLFGFPLRTDRQIPDTALLLCTGLGRDASFIDTRVSYKIEMPTIEELAQQVPT
jgi:hypothetical protein